MLRHGKKPLICINMRAEYNPHYLNIKKPQPQPVFSIWPS